MSYNINRFPWFHCMSPPHIYCGYRCRHPCILHLCHYNHRYSHRSKSLQLISYIAWGQYQMIPCYTMSPRFHFPVHSWRVNWHRLSQLISRYCSPRYILCCSTLPLCSVHRSGLRYHRGLRPLISPILRLHTKHNLSKNPFLNHVCRR